MLSLISKDKYPKLLEACQLIAWDCCEDEPDEVQIRGFNSDELYSAEIALRLLDKEDFEDFCIGDEDDREMLMTKAPGMVVADKLLTKYFDSL